VTTYSKRDRERAIEALLTCAAKWKRATGSLPFLSAVTPPTPVRVIACNAFADIADLNPDASFADTYGAAASLLYAGWDPSDPDVTPPKRAHGRGRGRQ
jgi:hypothetical protein